MSNTTHGPDVERDSLTGRVRSLLFKVAQHRFGSMPIDRERHLGPADALEQRGLIKYAAQAGRDARQPIICATDRGLQEITKRWPASPLVLGTHDTPAGGWTPLNPKPSASRGAQRANAPRCTARETSSSTADGRAPRRSRTRRRK